MWKLGIVLNVKVKMRKFDTVELLKKIRNPQSVIRNPQS